MNKDYYDVLALRRDACQEEVVESYKKMVLRWHPKFAKQDQNTAHHHFSSISQAYEVLSDPVKRSFYDKNGYQKLKQGHFAAGQLKGGYRFGNNADQIFQKFFESNNVLAKVFSKQITEKGSIFSSAFGALNFKQKQQNNDLVIKLPLTLQQLYRGMTKKVEFQRKNLNLDGRTLSLNKQQKLLQIKAGMGKGSVLCFKNEGNQDINRKRSDLIFQIQEIQDQLYSRNGDDLIYKANITLAQSLQCQPLEIKTLDNRKIRIPLDEIPNPKSLKEVPKEGMPKLSEKEKGNLYIKFQIKFPVKIEESVKSELRKLL